MSETLIAAQAGNSPPGEGHALVHAFLAAEVRSSGKLVDGTDDANTYVFTFRIRNGRIARVAEHSNALIVEEKMMPVVRATMADPAFRAPITSVWENCKHHWVTIPGEIQHFPKARQ